MPRSICPTYAAFMSQRKAKSFRLNPSSLRIFLIRSPTRDASCLLYTSDDGQVRPCADAADDLHAVYIGQPKIQQYDVRIVAGGHHDRRFPIGSSQIFIAVGLQAMCIRDSGETLDTETRNKICTDIFDDAQWLIGLVENLLSDVYKRQAVFRGRAAGKTARNTASIESAGF